MVHMSNGRDGHEPADGSLTHADYIKLNPSGYVPTLLVDGQPITEAPAILTYFASLALERNLLGSTPMEHVRTAEWLAWISGTVHGNGFAMLWRLLRFSDDESAYASIQEKGRKTVMACYDRVEQRLAGKKRAVGEQLTVVDVFLHTAWRWGLRRMGLDMEGLYPQNAEMVRAVEKLDSVRATMEEEGHALMFGIAPSH